MPALISFHPFSAPWLIPCGQTEFPSKPLTSVLAPFAFWLETSESLSSRSIGSFLVRYSAQVVLYVAGQCTAAIAAAAMLRLIFGNEAALGATVPSGSNLQSLGLEVVLTFFLMFVIAAVATDDRAVRAVVGPKSEPLSLTPLLCFIPRACESAAFES